MKKNSKRFLSLVLSFLLAFTTFVVQVPANTGLTVSSFDAVANMLVINFSADVTDATDSITLTKDGVAMESTTKVSGKQAVVIPTEDFVEGSAYGFEIPAGFGNETTTDAKINKFFTMTKVFFDNFGGYTVGADTATQTYLSTNYYHTYDNSKFYPIFARVADGRLLLNSNQGTFYVKSAEIAALENYSLSFNYKTYGADTSTSEFIVAFNAADSVTKLDKTSNPAPTMDCKTSMTKVAAYPGNINNILNLDVNPITSENCIAGTYTFGNYWAPSVPTEVSGKDFEYSFIKKGRTISCYVDGVLVKTHTYSNTHTGTNTNTKGYLGFLPYKNLSSIDDLAVMTCVEIEDPNKPVITKITGIDGTCDFVKLTFDQDMTGCTNAAEKIKIYDGAKAMDGITYTVSGKTIVAYSEKGFEPDKTYRMFIESELGVGKIKTDTVYAKEFKNKKVFFDNFEGYTVGADTATQTYLSTNYYHTYDNSKFYPIFARVADGRLLLNSNQGTFYVKSAEIAALENYSLSFNYKTYGADTSTSEFIVAFNTADSATKLDKTSNPAPTMDCQTSMTKVAAYPGNVNNILNRDINPITSENCIAGTYTFGNYWAPSVPTEVSGKDFEYSFIKKGRTISCYVDGVLVKTHTYSNTHTGTNTNTKGYLGFLPYKNLSSIDDLTVTTFTANECTTISDISLDYADKYGVVLNGVKGTLSENPAGIEVYDINEKKAVTIDGAEAIGNNMLVKAKLETGKPYKVTVKNGTVFENGVYSGADYSKVFMVKEVLKVEPTIESMKQLNSDLAAPEKEVVQGDGYVAVKGTHLQTPQYRNATIEMDIAYYSDTTGGAPYIDTYFNHNNKVATYTDGQKYSVGGFRLYCGGVSGGSLWFRIFAAKNTVTADEIEKGITDSSKLAYSGNYITNTGITSGVYEKDGSAWNGKFAQDVEPHTQRFVKVGNAYRFYINDTVKLNYNNSSMNDYGYLYMGQSSKGLIKFYGMTVTEMELVDTIALNVSDITADAREIKVSFDQNIKGATDFSKVEILENGVAVDAAYTVAGKDLTIVPAGGIKSGAIYSVTVKSGFGPSEICQISADVNKNFKVTVYADADFANGADEDVTFSGIVDYKDGAALFTNGSMVINSDEIADAEDYVVKYDYKHYAALEIGGQYNVDAPASELWFNCEDTTNAPGEGLYWKFGKDAVLAMANNEALADALALTTKYGDAIVIDETIIPVSKGENLEEYELFIGEEIVTESLHETAEYVYEVQKIGAGASLLRDGKVVHTFTGDEIENASDVGYFGLNASATDVIYIDNIQAYTFEEVEGIEISIDVANGKAIVSNFDDEAVEMVVVVAAYDEDNGMLSSFKSEAITVEKGVTEVPYTLENVVGAKVYKAFAWDDLDNLDPYCEAAIYKVK